MGNNYLSVTTVMIWRPSSRSQFSSGSRWPFQGDTTFLQPIREDGGTRDRRTQAKPAEPGQLGEVAKDILGHPHLRPPQEPSLQQSRKLDHPPAGEIQLADQLHESQIAGIPHIEGEDGAPPVHPKAAGVGVELLTQD